MSYRSSGGRRRKRGPALVISYLVQAAVILLVVAAVLLLVQGARKAFGMAASTLKPQESRPEASSTVVPPAASSVLPSVSQSTPTTPPEPPEEPSAPVVLLPLGVVTIDPGHGGIDPGCGEVGALEKDIVLSISKLVQEMLMEQNVSVVMTRDTDKYVSLDDRTAIANDARSDLFVSIHCNAFEGKASGMECYYYKNEDGKQLATDITAAAAEQGIKTREVRSQKYQVLWGTKMPAVLVETGFLTDEAECALLMTPEYQEKVAAAIAQTVVKTLEARTEPLA